MYRSRFHAPTLIACVALSVVILVLAYALFVALLWVDGARSPFEYANNLIIMGFTYSLDCVGYAFEYVGWLLRMLVWTINTSVYA